MNLRKSKKVKGKEIKNMEDLRNELITLFEDVRDGRVGLVEARIRNRIATNILRGVQQELVAFVLENHKQSLPFLKPTKMIEE